MLKFLEWAAIQPLAEYLSTAKVHLGRALAVQNSNKTAMEILPHINAFKDAIDRAANKASQGSNETLARDLTSVFHSLNDEADAAISEVDPSIRRYRLSGLLRRMDAELTRPTSVQPTEDDAPPLGVVNRVASAKITTGWFSSSSHPLAS